MKKRQATHAKQAKHVGDGALQGVVALGSGIFHGVTGVVVMIYLRKHFISPGETGRRCYKRWRQRICKRNWCWTCWVLIICSIKFTVC